VRRIPTILFVFALGSVVGHLTASRREPPQKVEPADFTGDVLVFPPSASGRALRPYCIITDGQAHRLSPPPPDALNTAWRISFDNGRVMVFCVEEPTAGRGGATGGREEAEGE
jgi:hypothetical protein